MRCLIGSAENLPTPTPSDYKNRSKPYKPSKLPLEDFYLFIQRNLPSSELLCFALTRDSLFTAQKLSCTPEPSPYLDALHTRCALT
jgi:hypothetical protein